MKPINRRTAIKLTVAGAGALAITPSVLPAADAAQPFGTEFPNLDSLATGEWWTKGVAAPGQRRNQGQGQPPPPPMDVPRDQVVEFELKNSFKDEPRLRFLLPQDVVGTFELTDVHLRELDNLP